MCYETIKTEIVKYTPIIVGWILGILSGLILDKRKKRLQKKEIKKGVLSELKGLQTYLAGICIHTTIHSGKVDLEWSKWIKQYFDKLYDIDNIEHIIEKGEDYSQVIAYNETQFYNFLLSKEPFVKTQISWTFTHVTTPYLNSKYGSISNFDEKFQFLISKLRKEIDLLNSEFNQCWFHYTKTFDDISDVNRKVVESNIDQAVGRIANESKGTIKLIQKILDI